VPDHPSAPVPTHDGVPGLSRRTALAGLGAGALFVLGGCRLGPDDEVDGATEQQRDADESLVDRARADVGAVRLLAERTGRRHVGLSPAMTPLVSLHDEHLRVLGGTAAVVTSPAVARRGPRALADVRTAEVRLQARLAAHAANATSGRLARALASMSAAVAQHVAVFPEPAEGPA